METPLNVLMVEDSDDDSLMLTQHLRRHGFDLVHERVETGEEMSAALGSKAWDVVLCDYNLPRFNPYAALAVLRETGLDLPFIVVSGMIGEERAVELMQAGAHDLILKGGLARLVPAIERELTEARIRREHRVGETALKESKAQLLDAQRIAKLGNWAWDTIEDRQLYCSDEGSRIFGLPPGTVLASFDECLACVHPDDRERVRAVVERAHEDGREYEVEYKVNLPDGEERFVLERAEPDFDDRGVQVRKFGTVQDITERKRSEAALRHAESQLQQAQKMEAVGHLTGGIAHDFNNLLTIVLGNLQLLEQDIAGNPRLHKRVEVAERAVMRGAELTQRLLAFSRRQVLEPEVINVGELVSGMRDLLHRTLGESVEMEVDIVGDLPLTRVDPGQLESALVNLAINARDAMVDGGQLTIEVSHSYLDDEDAANHPSVEPGQYVTLAVTDSGTGISPDVMDRVLEPFFTTKEVGKGSGLGLSMVYGFVEQSGGHIELDSEVGQGTTVTLYLPVARGGRPDAVEKARNGENMRAGTETILVVEDDEAVRETTAMLLHDLGYRVLEAEDGPSALAIVDRKEQFDLLFTDVVMPGGMNGPALARQLEMHIPHIKVLFTSGYSHDAVTSGIDLNDGAELIRKPFSKKDLALKVRQALES